MRISFQVLVLSSLCASLVAAPVEQFDALVIPFKQVTVSAPVQGVIQKIMVKEGGRVKEGDLLAQLLAVEEQLEAKRAEKVLQKRKFENQSALKLITDKVISEDEALEKSIEQDLAALQLETAKSKLDKMSIKSPLSGIVVERHKEDGEAVNLVEPMFAIVDIDKVFVQFYVKEEDASQIKPGQEVRVTIPAVSAPHEFAGKIDFIDPRIDAASGLLKVKALVANEDNRIKSGMRGKVRPVVP